MVSSLKGKSTMRAAVFRGPNNMRMEEVPVPECPPGGCVLRVKAVGICGSDVRTYHNGSHKIIPPMILGHEVVGEVVQTDSAHTAYTVGDRLAMAPGIWCGTCWYCEHGMSTVCENLRELAFQFPGGFAEYMPLPAVVFDRGRVVKVPDGLSDEHAALCEMHSACIMAQERANIRLGETVVVLGAGPVGCMHVELARARGAACVILVNRTRERLQTARFTRADHYLDASAGDPVAEVMRITQGLGADHVIVAAPTAAAAEQAVRMARKRGTVVYYAGLPKDSPRANLDINAIHYRDITIIGHYGQERRHVAESLAMIARGQCSADKVITHRLPLEHILDGIKLMDDRKALKVMLKP